MDKTQIAEAREHMFVEYDGQIHTISGFMVTDGQVTGMWIRSESGKESPFFSKSSYYPGLSEVTLIGWDLPGPQQ